MKPWELSTAANKEDYLLREWAKLKPIDFYVAGQGGPETKTTIYIVPRLFFHEHQHMYKESMPISHLLPKGFVEKFPCIFNVRAPLLVVYKEMVDAGFSFNKDFQILIDKTPITDFK